MTHHSPIHTHTHARMGDCCHVYFHWEQLGFSILPKDTSTCGQLEPAFERPILVSVLILLNQLSHSCLIFMHKSIFGLGRSRTFSIPSFLLPLYFSSSQNNKYFFGQTTKPCRETNTVVLVILTSALRGVGNN